MKGILVSFLAALIVCAAAQTPAEPPAATPVETPPVSTPVQSPVVSPAEVPVASPAATPVVEPAVQPVSNPSSATPVEAPSSASPVLAPSSASPVLAPISASPVLAPSSAPVASPALSPTAPPVASPVSSGTDLCYANGCTFFDAVNASEVLFGGSFGASYSPRCIRVSAPATIVFSGDFNVHPLVQGLIVGSTPYPTSAPVVGTNSYEVQYSTPGVYPFYSNSLYQQGMKGAVYVGTACANSPRAAAVPPTSAAMPLSEEPTSNLYSCEINGCTSRNIRQFGAPRSGEPAPRAIEFGDERGFRYSIPCLYIPVGGSITISGDFTRFPLQTGFSDGRVSVPNDNLALSARVKDLQGKTNVTIADLPAGVYPFYSPPYASLGMYGAVFVGVCGSASSLLVPVSTMALALLISLFAVRL